jgi:hypothetical protein
MQKGKGAILCFPRTGSSTLSRVLGCQKGLTLCGEPFNLLDADKKYTLGLESLYQTMSINQSLDKLFSQFNIIQHKFHNIRMLWNVELIKYLKTHQIPTMFLYRTDYLSWVKSRIISLEIKLWSKHERNPETYQVNEISMRKVFRYIEIMEIQRAYYLNKMNEVGLAYKVLTYEELFQANKSENEQYELIFELIDFFQIHIDDQAIFKEKTKKWLHPSRKMNSKKTHQIIPNIEEINHFFNEVTNIYQSF